MDLALNVCVGKGWLLSTLGSALALRPAFTRMTWIHVICWMDTVAPDAELDTKVASNGVRVAGVPKYVPSSQLWPEGSM